MLVISERWSVGTLPTLALEIAPEVATSSSLLSSDEGIRAKLLSCWGWMEASSSIASSRPACMGMAPASTGGLRGDDDGQAADTRVHDGMGQLLRMHEGDAAKLLSCWWQCRGTAWNHIVLRTLSRCRREATPGEALGYGSLIVACDIWRPCEELQRRLGAATAWTLSLTL